MIHVVYAGGHFLFEHARTHHPAYTIPQEFVLHAIHSSLTDCQASQAPARVHRRRTARCHCLHVARRRRRHFMTRKRQALWSSGICRWPTCCWRHPGQCQVCMHRLHRHALQDWGTPTHHRCRMASPARARAFHAAASLPSRSLHQVGDHAPRNLALVRCLGRGAQGVLKRD